MYTLNLSEESYSLAKNIDFSELKNRIAFNDEQHVITISETDMDVFMVIISEEIDMKGLSEDQQEVTLYGRKLYRLYDEVYVLKYKQSKDGIDCILKISDETKTFLQSNCPNIQMDRQHLNELLDFLDDMELDSLDENYNLTDTTKSIIYAIDDLYANNE